MQLHTQHTAKRHLTFTSMEKEISTTNCMCHLCWMVCANVTKYQAASDSKVLFGYYHMPSCKHNRWTKRQMILILNYNFVPVEAEMLKVAGSPRITGFGMISTELTETA
jgi:hypothetical protein